MNKKDVIIALDFKDRAETMDFLQRFTDEKPFVKIGMELFYGEGPDIVREIKDRGHSIFLDLKLHDIPMTVKKAMKNLALLGVDMTNLHCAGTIEMMKYAMDGLTEGALETGRERALLIGVTQLTSTSEERMQKELLINASINDCIVKYAENAKEAGNMKRSKIYRCSKCGNVIMQTGNNEMLCCGQRLEPLNAIDADEGHGAQFEEMDGEYYVTFGHEMTRTHSIELIVCLTDDGAFIKKLYPEQDASCRVPIFRRGRYYCFCNIHGLFKIK